MFNTEAVMGVSNLRSSRDQPKILLGKNSTTNPYLGPDKGLCIQPSRVLALALLDFGYISVSKRRHFLICAMEIAMRIEK